MLITFENWPENMKTSNPITDYYKNFDPEYLTNRIEEEYVDCIHVDNSEDESVKEEEENTDWTLGRLQTWYAGRELSNLGSIVDFQADRKLREQFQNTPVNRVSYSGKNDAYQKTNILGIYNETK